MNNTSFGDAYERCKYLSILEDSDLSTKIIKLGEEKGEINEAYLRSISYKKPVPGKNPEEDINEECVDVLIMCLSILASRGVTEEQILATMDTKMDKWQNKYMEKG